MSILNKMKGGVGTAKWKADQLLQIQKVQMEISDVRNKISIIHGQIVTTTLDLHQRGGLSQAELEELCHTIDNLKAEIASKEARIEEIKRKAPPVSFVPLPENTAFIVCPHCYAKNSSEAAFCTSCGVAISPSDDPQASPEMTANIKCLNCGHENTADAVFCNSCGVSIK